MKILLISFFAFVFFDSNVYAELKDCNQFKKLSKDYLICTKDNLKIKSADMGITDKVKDFKDSKSMSEFLSKQKDSK